jgi:tRNA (guanine-N7-)-methyltransferase
MGRRALKKPDPKLDLSQWFLSTDNLPGQLTAESLFGLTAPLEIEVGSGKGLFMRRAAAAIPDHLFLGIEVGYKYAEFAAGGLAKRNLTNAKMAHGDALAVFNDRVPDDSLEAVHVYFPDPWWKVRHRKRRVLNEPFLKNTYRTLRPGGRLHFWTDVQEYYETTLELIDQIGQLAGPFEVPEPQSEHNMDFHTHFERRTRLNEAPVYRAEFEKRAQ